MIKNKKSKKKGLTVVDRSVILVELSEIIVSRIETILIDFWKKKEILKSAWQLKTFVLK